MEVNSTIFKKMRDCIFGNDVERLKKLLSTQQNANFQDANGESLLGLAAAGGFLNSVDVLLAAGADINRADKNDVAYTPLIRAAREGQLSMVQRLVEKGANLETGDSRGGTAILHSCIGAHRDVLEYLIGVGGNVNAVDDRGQSPLHHLCQYARQWGDGTITETVNGTTRHVKNPRFAQHTEILKIVIAASADLNLETFYGYTPLHWAAAMNTSLFVKLLIDAGANVHHANRNGYTALHAGADKGSFESCARLLDFGANKDAADMYGFTPLIGAVVGGHERIVQLLLDNGADKNKTVSVGYEKVAAGDRAVDVAVKLGREVIIRMLGGDKYPSVL